MAKEKLTEEEIKEKTREKFRKKQIEKEEERRLKQLEKEQQKRNREREDLIEDQFKKKQIPSKYLKILTNPDLFEIINKELDKKIVGEEPTRKTIYLCSNGRFVENSQVASYNLLVNSDTGTGKDYVAEKTLAILPSEHYIKKTRISPTAFTYWHNSKFEPNWTWDGMVFYTEDIGEGVLNSEVFKVMCSSGSSATITMNQMAIDIEIKGKPVMITTTASASPNPEMVRRFVMLMLDESMDQTKAIMKRHSEFKKKGIIPEYDPDLIEAQKYLRRVKIKIPFADLIDKHFPSENVIMRTNYPRFLDFVCASAGLHQYQRIEDNDGFILAEGKDYDIARECFLKLFSNKYMIPLTRNQREILKYFEENPHLEGSVTELYNTHGVNFLSDRALETNLKLLVRFGILKTFTKKDVMNRDITSYSIKKSYTENNTLNIPNYASISSVSSIPSLSSVSSISPINKENQKDTEASEDTEGIKRPPVKFFEWSEADKKRMLEAGGDL